MTMVLTNSDPDPYDPLAMKLVEWANLDPDEAAAKAERIRLGIEPWPSGLRPDDYDRPTFTTPDLTLGGMSRLEH
jgi:hypothetical protein